MLLGELMLLGEVEEGSRYEEVLYLGHLLQCLHHLLVCWAEIYGLDASRRPKGCFEKQCLQGREKNLVVIQKIP